MRLTLQARPSSTATDMASDGFSITRLFWPEKSMATREFSEMLLWEDTAVRHGSKTSVSKADVCLVGRTSLIHFTQIDSTLVHLFLVVLTPAGFHSFRFIEFPCGVYSQTDLRRVTDLTL